MSRRRGAAGLLLTVLLLAAGCGADADDGHSGAGRDLPSGRNGASLSVLLSVRLEDRDGSIARAFLRLEPGAARLVKGEEPDAEDLVIEREAGRHRLAGHVTRNRMPVGTATASQVGALARDAGAWKRDTLAPAARAAGIALPDGDATYWRPTPMPLEVGALIAVRATGGATEDVRGFLFVEGVSEDGALQVRVYPRIYPRPAGDGR